MHVLGPPLTFALSQDQTLQLNFRLKLSLQPVQLLRLLSSENHDCRGIRRTSPEGEALFLPFELGLLFSFQRPTRKIPVTKRFRHAALQGGQSLFRVASESIESFKKNNVFGSDSGGASAAVDGGPQTPSMPAKFGACHCQDWPEIACGVNLFGLVGLSEMRGVTGWRAPFLRSLRQAPRGSRPRRADRA